MAIFVVISIVGIFFISTIRDGHDWGSDFSMYIHHAKNIVENRSYADTGYIYNPDYSSLSPRAYPPIFPLLLAPIYKLFGLNLKAMKIYLIVFFLMALMAIYKVFKDKLASEHIIGLIAIIGFSPWFWTFKENILSDIPFLLFVFIAFIIYEKSCKEISNSMISYIYFIFLGIIIYISYGTRIPGLILLPSVIIHQIIKKNKIKYAIYIPVLTFTILFFVQKLSINNIESSYTDQFFSVAPEYILYNIVYYCKSMNEFWNNGLSRNLGIVVFIFVSIISVVGFLYQLRKEISIYIIFTILYFILIVVWPSQQGLRFLIPIIPFYLFYFIKGFEILYNRYPLYLSRSIFIAFLLIVSAMYTATYMSSDFGPLPNGISKKESVEMFNFISDNTSLDSVFIFRKPRALALFTNRNASVYPEKKPSDNRELWLYIIRIRATYLINWEDQDPEYFKSFLRENIKKLDRVYSNNNFIVYKIKKEVI